MATPEHLNNAPIREGLVTIQYEPVAVQSIKEFAAKIRDKYDSASEIWQGAWEFQLDAGAFKQSGNIDGLRFDSPKDGPPHVVMAQRASFTFSRLKPYADWDELKNIAKPMWDLFVSMTKPTFVNRVSVRYVNVMELPLQPGEKFSKYLKAAPEVPDGLPQALSAFLQRVVMIDPATENMAVVMQALEEAPSDAPARIILDIEAIRARTMNPIGAEVWGALDTLRDFKNDIFFKHITDDAVEIFR